MECVWNPYERRPSTGRQTEIKMNLSPQKSSAEIHPRRKGTPERISIAWWGLSFLGVSYLLMGSWFVWFRIDEGFWPFTYVENNLTLGLSAGPASSSVHIPEMLVSVTFYLVVISFILMAIGTWKKMPKP